MSGPGLTTSEGPICRTVEDAARMYWRRDVGYDAKDPLTAFTIGREPAQPYPSYARGDRLDGVRIGVVREFMDKRLFTKRDEAAIAVVDRAVADLATGATVVDPGAGGRAVHIVLPEVCAAGIWQALHAAASGSVPGGRNGQADGRSHREARRE